MDEVLEEHQEALEDRGEGRSRFIQQPGGYGGEDVRDPEYDVRAAAAEQDTRRAAAAGPSGTVAAAAKVVDAVEADREELYYLRYKDATTYRPERQYQDKYDKQGRLIMSAQDQADAAAERARNRTAAGPSVARLPAPLDSMGGDTPNADRLRLKEKPAPPRSGGSMMKLKHNPAGGGGFHNPHAL